MYFKIKTKKKMIKIIEKIFGLITILVQFVSNLTGINQFPLLEEFLFSLFYTFPVFMLLVFTYDFLNFIYNFLISERCFKYVVIITKVVKNFIYLNLPLILTGLLVFLISHIIVFLILEIVLFGTVFGYSAVENSNAYFGVVNVFSTEEFDKVHALLEKYKEGIADCPNLSEAGRKSAINVLLDLQIENEKLKQEALAAAAKDSTLYFKLKGELSLYNPPKKN